jgi:MFS family permease
MGFSSPTRAFISARLNLGQHPYLLDLAFALICVGAVIGALTAGKLADRIGRRRALMWTAPVFCAGVLLLAFELSFWGLCVGRTVVGIAVGEASGTTSFV